MLISTTVDDLPSARVTPAEVVPKLMRQEPETELDGLT
jgi:hypothetical protein